MYREGQLGEEDGEGKEGDLSLSPTVGLFAIYPIPLLPVRKRRVKSIEFEFTGQRSRGYGEVRRGSACGTQHCQGLNFTRAIYMGAIFYMPLNAGSRSRRPPPATPSISLYVLPTSLASAAPILSRLLLMCIVVILYIV